MNDNLLFVKVQVATKDYDPEELKTAKLTGNTESLEGEVKWSERLINLTHIAAVAPSNTENYEGLTILEIVNGQRLLVNEPYDEFTKTLT